MRKPLALSLFANVLLCVFIFYHSGTTPQVDADCVDEPCAHPPCCNGDVNGDGHMDLSDAIYLLTYLFADGGEPAVIEWAGCGENRPLPATGQTKCYDASGLEIDCNSEAYPGQDGFYQKGCSMAGRFVDNGNGTVTDHCTGLMWQQATADINKDGQIVESDDRITWAEALRYCDALEFAGHDDWRLPNVRELQSLVDYGRSGPAIDPVFSVESEWYWSSTTVLVLISVFLPGIDDAWYVGFNLGHMFYGRKNVIHNHVLAVRG